MRQFDEMLRRGLMEANLAQYETVLEKLPDWEIDFSPKYRRERMRLLADPWNWVRRRARPMWKRAARTAACVVLACTVALGALMAVSPTVRAAVTRWFRETFEGYTYYTGSTPEEEEIPPEESFPAFRPTWVPEGYVLAQVYTNGLPGVPEDVLSANWVYENGEDTLQFSCYLRPSGNVGAGYGAVVEETAVRRRTTVQGCGAEFYQEEMWNSLIWENGRGNLFWLHSMQDQATLERVGESVMEITTDPLLVYELPKLPEGARQISRDVLPEYVSTFWALDRTRTLTLTFTYSTLPLDVRGTGTEETVDVNGLAARFWQGEKKEYTSTGFEKDGTPVTTSVEACCNALLWTDPEMEIRFFLQGHLDREDLLHMAENLRLSTGENPAEAGT